MNHSHSLKPNDPLRIISSGNESESTHASPALLNISFCDVENAHNHAEEKSIIVAFVDEEGNSLSHPGGDAMGLAGIPSSARFPSGDTKHDILFGKRGALLAVQVETKKELALSHVREAGGRIVRALQNEKFTTATVFFDLHDELSPKAKEMETLQAFLHGLQAATYGMTDFKSKKKERALASVRIVAEWDRGNAETCAKVRDFVNDIAIAENLSRRWIDLPAQEGAMSTNDLVRVAHKVARRGNSDDENTVAIEVISRDQLQKRGLNALWSVGKGRTDSPPALVMLHYKGASEKAPTVALVGKGIVFDTGGENLKPESSIDGMHVDMAGAAIALATFDLAVRRKAKVNLVAALCIADNSISGSSYHPRSVITAYNKKTIEVLNTDAEGRLVLVDGVCYVEKNYKPDYLITLATLTGACVIALGNEFAGLFAKSEEIAKALQEASRRTWNKVWRMPLDEAEHTKLKPSAIADVSNLGEKPGGAVTAAKFILTEFVKTKHAAHLDVAGVAASIMGKAVDATGAPCSLSTGWGPALLWEAIHILTKKGKKQ